MRRQSVIVLAIAVFLGLIAVYLVNAYLGSAEKQQQTAVVGLTQVAVARIPLEFGTPITADKVRFVNWPSDSVPEGAFRSAAQLTPVGKVHVALRSMEAGEPILRSRVSGAGGRATLSAVLPPEMRATAIRITDVAGVAGFVLPGDRVDVILTRNAGGDANNQIAETLLQDLRVIAIDQDSNDSTDKPVIGKTATLEVQPYDAQKLALAQTVGQLSLSLRSVRAQQGESFTESVSTRDLQGGAGGGFAQASYAGPAPSYAQPLIRNRAPARPRRPAPSNLSKIEVIRGTLSSDYAVGRYGGN